MRYEMMYPDQIRKAIDENWPVVLPAGVIEYHSEHCVVGVDTLLVIRAVEELEKEMDLVILPPFHYGSASYAVEPPERNGTVHVDSEVVHTFAKEMFKGLLRVGFRNIHVIVHHQSENFAVGMPTDLAFKFAGRQAIFDVLDKHGDGWWGDNSMSDYYSSHESGANPFNWIQVHPLMCAEAQAKFPIDHASKQESSLMMAFCPEGIDNSKLSTEKWYVKDAVKANMDYGRKAREMTLEGLRKVLKCQ